MKIDKLIALVKERPILYDSLNPLSKDRTEKEKMWREISSAMNVHSDLAKSRWKSLKDCYTKYLKSTVSTGPAIYLKYNNWQWAVQMEFMKPYLKFGLIITNMELQDSKEKDNLGTQHSLDVQGYQSSLEELEIHEKCEKTEQCGMSDWSETYEGSRTSTRSRTVGREKDSERYKKQKKSKMCEIASDKVRRRRGTARSSPEEKTDRIIQYLKDKKTESYNATELIFLGYAKSIKTFSIRRQAQVKMKIAKIMMEEEIAHLEEMVSHSQYKF